VYQALQGNVGLGKAIEYFTSHGLTVSLPLNDTQKYDLVVELDGSLSRVQVKTSRNRKSSGAYEVVLKRSGGASGKHVITPFDNNSCDHLFVYTSDGRMYLIPASKVRSTSSITVGIKYGEYEVRSFDFSEFASKVV
jgi:DNA gyrase/topoisomerase IV subunit A